MPVDCVSYKESGYFSQLIVDYLEQHPDIRPFYHRFPSIKNFEDQIREKSENFTTDRNLLADAIQKQYKDIPLSEKTRKNIDLLRSSSTFTVTTGHQLNLFTGPLYFLYKIVTAINLAKSLKETYPSNDFVPVYWMATEDHDFEEINHFIFHGKKFRWNREASGPVGRLDTKTLDEFFRLFQQELGPSDAAARLRKLFEDAYLKHDKLADATRFLANELFGKYGLVIIDGDDRSLKQQFAPIAKEELLHQVSYQKVSETASKLSAYNVQVNPREINLFYIEDGLRERIIRQGGEFVVNNTSIRLSEAEILDELEKHPEKFSPNVIMRPLYQEVILPNLCYIGGGGEIAYWLELESYFDLSSVTFPILMLRNSVLLTTQKQAEKVDRLRLNWSDLFLKQTDLITKKTKQISELPLDFSSHRDRLHQLFSELKEIAGKTDKSFGTAVAAQETRQLKGFANLEKKLLRAEKRAHDDLLRRVCELQDELFPGGLQERKLNFSEFFILEPSLTDVLVDKLNPWATSFTIITI